MREQDYHLDSTVLKTAEALTLYQTERCVVKVGKDALVLEIKRGDTREGYIFHGHGGLLLDTIVETHAGAVGKPVEKEINEPFLMLSDNTEEIQKHLDAVSSEDLARIGCESRKEVMAKAGELFDRFFEGERMHGPRCCRRGGGSIFAFANENHKLDVLVVSGSKLVYKALKMVYVASGNKTVLKSPEQIVLSSNGRLCIVKD